jgi:hypothetical protein
VIDNILIPANLSVEKTEALKKYLKDRILSLKNGMRELFEEKLIKWNAAYEARPAEAMRQFPFQNASNLVIPLVGIHTDTLHAQVMAAIFKTHPIVVSKVFGDPGPQSDKLKEAYEEYMQYVALEPEELDLYRVYGEGIRECIKYGTTTYKAPWEETLRSFMIPGGDGSGKERDFETKTIYSGPRPEKLPFNGFYIPPTAKSIEDADFKAHKKPMLRWEIEERMHTGLYNKKAVEEILKTPDRTGPDQVQKEKEGQLGAKTDQSYGAFAHEWDIWECHVQWRYEDEAFAPRMIVTYHEKSNQIVRVLWDNFKPEWFISSRMAKRDDMYHGYGFGEILWAFQEGASETYNGYRDNQTVANTRVWRVSPDSKLHQGYRIYPSAMLPAEKDEIEALAHGDLSEINIDELRLLLDLAERRSGVSPPQQGYGAGVTTGKRGIYSAMGTLAVLQEGNTRKDINVSDMRDSHTRLMRLVTEEYAVFGKGDKFHRERLAKFGKQADLIKEAIEQIHDKKISLPCYASTASINREVEKQNDLMLTMVMSRHYQMIAQLLGATQQPNTPPLVKEYFVEVVVAADLLMRKILRNFGHEEVDRLVPDPFKEGGAAAKATQPQQAIPQGVQPNGNQPQPNTGQPAQPNTQLVGGPSVGPIQ